jgi:hypothetical protein
MDSKVCPHMRPFHHFCGPCGRVPDSAKAGSKSGTIPVGMRDIERMQVEVPLGEDSDSDPCLHDTDFEAYYEGLCTCEFCSGRTQ